jgi:hypothetical protein
MVGSLWSVGGELGDRAWTVFRPWTDEFWRCAASSLQADKSTAYERRAPMKYILQMMVDEGDWQALTPEQMQPMIDAMEGYNDELREAGAWVSGEGLDYSSNAKTVRVTDGTRSVVDGPSSAAKEQLGGLWIIQAASIDDAVDWAKRVPMTNGAIEVRGLVPEE